MALGRYWLVLQLYQGVQRSLRWERGNLVGETNTEWRVLQAEARETYFRNRRGVADAGSIGPANTCAQFKIKRLAPELLKTHTGSKCHFLIKSREFLQISFRLDATR
jgi:hypothetical protein